MELKQCPYCGNYFDTNESEFAICPYCERDVEVNGEEETT